MLFLYASIFNHTKTALSLRGQLRRYRTSLPLLAFLKTGHNGEKVPLPTMTHTLLLDPESGSTQDAPHAISPLIWLNS